MIGLAGIHEQNQSVQAHATRKHRQTGATPDEILDFEESIAPRLDALLGGIRASPRRIADISEHPVLVTLIKSRLEDRMTSLEENLEKVNRDLDSDATLAAVTGDGTVETVRK